MIARRGLLVVLVMMFVLPIASCDQSAPQAKDPTSSQTEPLRLAVLSPALSATLVRMGLGEHIVARHAYDMVLDRSVPSAGDESALDVEALIQSRPTHVLIDAMSRESLAYVQEIADRSGWTVHAFDLRTLDAISESARELRRLLAPNDAGAEEAIASFERDVAPREFAFDGWLLLLAQTEPAGAIGPASFHGEILERFGVHNVLPDTDRWRELDAEDVLRLAPDAIVLIRWHTPGIDPELLSDDTVLAALGPLAELDIPAIEEGRVAMIDDPLALTPSLAMGDFARRLGEILDSFEN